MWTLRYLRFWIVKTLVQVQPAGPGHGRLPPLHALPEGARRQGGARRAIFTRSVPVCTDLLTIGDNTVIRKEAVINGYRAQAGVIRTGTVMMGHDVFVGEKTVLDIDTSFGGGTQLRPVPPPCTPARGCPTASGGTALPREEGIGGLPDGRAGAAQYRARVVYATQQLLTAVAGLAAAGARAASTLHPRQGAAPRRDHGPRHVGRREPARSTSSALVASAVLFSAFTPWSASSSSSRFPRLLNLTIAPDEVYGSTASPTGCTG